MDPQPMTLEERRSRLEAAREVLDGLDSVLYQASGPELTELMLLADSLAAKSGAARVSVTVEAVNRGEVAAAGTTTHAWVRDHAPSLRQGGAGDVARLALAVASGTSRWRPGGADVDSDSPLGIVWAGVAAGTVSPALATAVIRELERVEPLLVPEAVPTVTHALLDLGVAWGSVTICRLRPRLLAEHGRAGVLDDLQARLASAARLSSPMVESADLTEYQLLMTPDQAAALEAAIGTLSAPAPDDETGERDLRPAGQRRVEALTEVCRRSSAMDAGASGADGAAAAAAAVHVTIALTDLQARTGCGEVLGSTATGTLLSPEVLRRISCEADLVPHVLGTAGEDLDLGRVVRLFTRAQRRRLWRRDRGCTYPGCTAPAAWSRAHHVVHWADHGPSDIGNAALLCQRHHTRVHQRRLVAQVNEKPDDLGRHVVWDLADGSYDRHLERLRAERSAHDPPLLTPQRWRSLLVAVTSDDLDDRRWAESELALVQPDGVGVDDACLDEVWTVQCLTELEAAS
ncbi:MAG TPA: HNH endonuclease [Ornithinibacter sp.]|nr:HNH endonuclease [Ornithinibacter sp.]